MKLSIVIPVHSEEQHVLDVLRRVAAAFRAVYCILRHGLWAPPPRKEPIAARAHAEP